MSSFLFSVLNSGERILRPGANTAFQIIKRGDKCSIEQFKKNRNSAFKSLIKHSYETVPFYKMLFSSLNLSPKDFEVIDDLQKLPPLTKENIRQAGDNLLSTIFLDKKVFRGRSGGTTGEPIETVLDYRAYYIEYYAYLRGLKWMGLDSKTQIVKLFGGSLGTGSGKSIFASLKNKANSTVFVPAFNLNKESVDGYISLFQKRANNVIIGYASTLYNFVLLIKDCGYTKDQFNVNQIFYTAEEMLPHWSSELLSFFDCPIKGFYGCGEINSLGFQLEANGSYQIPSDHVEIEAIEVWGQKNTLAITPLFNYAKPLLRYINGDLGEIGTSENGKYKEIIELKGRSDDLFKRSDGTLVSSALAPHVIQKTKIPFQQYQVIQLDVHLLEFRYKMSFGELLETQKSELLRIFKETIDEGIKIEFNETEDFILSKNGKLRIMISRI